MIYETGDMWSVYPISDLFCITTNGDVNRFGEAVMGRGIALEAATRFPTLRQAAAKAILAQSRKEVLGRAYGLLVSDKWPASKLALFQVKWHWDQKADPNLIALSCLDLAVWMASHAQSRVDLNFPGIGNGGLDVSMVQPRLEGILKDFDHLHLWRKA